MKPSFVVLAGVLLILLCPPLTAQIKISPPPVLKKPVLPLPDLVLTRFELWPANGATTNDMISYYIEITNRGVLPAVFKQGDILIQISLPGQSSPFQWPVTQDLTVGSERPWHAGQNILRPGQVPAGAYSLKAIADPGNRVAESDESNNQAALSWTIVTAGKPDLLISDIYTQQFQLGGDLCLNIVVTVKNVGLGNAYIAYKTNILNCAELSTVKTVQNETIYKPGDSGRFIFTLLNFVGPRTLVFTIDPENMVKEADETNNSRAFLAEVK